MDKVIVAALLILASLVAALLLLALAGCEPAPTLGSPETARAAAPAEAVPVPVVPNDATQAVPSSRQTGVCGHIGEPCCHGQSAQGDCYTSASDAYRVTTCEYLTSICVHCGLRGEIPCSINEYGTWTTFCAEGTALDDQSGLCE